MIHQKLCLLILALFPFAIIASPPIDVTRPEVPQKNRNNRPKQIQDEDLVFQDVNDPVPKTDINLAIVRSNVIGRSLPERKGKALVRFSERNQVRFLKASKDGRWVAVQAIRSGRKAWVPKSSIELLSQNKKEQKNIEATTESKKSP